MSIKRNGWGQLLCVIEATTPKNKHIVRAEKVVLAVTLVALLALAACSFAKVGFFASCDYSHIIGWSCLGLSAAVVLIKGILLSLKCNESYISEHARERFRCKTVVITEEDMQNAIADEPYEPYIQIDE